MPVFYLTPKNHPRPLDKKELQRIANRAPIVLCQDYNTSDLWPTGSYDRVYLVKEAIESCEDHKDTMCLKDYLTNSIDKWDGSMGQISFDNNGDIVTEIYSQYFNEKGEEVKEKIKK